MIPHRTGTIQRHARAGGFTLLELLLVMGILVILAAIAWPSFSRPLATTRLREGARAVCNEIALARLRAIETGNVLVLRYESGGARYTITTRTAAIEGSDYGDGGLSGTASALGGRSRRWPAGEFEPVRGELPDGIRFVRAGASDDELFNDGGSFLDSDSGEFDDPDSLDSNFAAPSNGGDDFDSISDGLSGGIGGGTTVTLYPDGTARDATLRLANQKGASIEITLRGMTGTTRLGRVIEPEVTP